jgi:CRISPR-associated protein Csd2
LRNPAIKVNLKIYANALYSVVYREGAVVCQDHVPADIWDLYEVHDYKHAAAILATEFPAEFGEICNALRRFRFTEEDVTTPGGNESRIPKKFSDILRPMGWLESQLNAKLVIDDEVVVSHDTHKVDYIKGRVAFDLEWNSKDQTFDRDLYAFRAFFDYDRISAGVLVTRSNELDPYFSRLGNLIKAKYGASTTHMGKLLPRLGAGRNGGCPVLVFGITPRLLIER